MDPFVFPGFIIEQQYNAFQFNFSRWDVYYRNSAYIQLIKIWL